MNDIKFTKSLEKLLEQKEKDYGGFDYTSYIMTKIMSEYLTFYNNKDVKVPIKFFGIIMIFLKCWRVMQSDRYKADSFDDIQGYAELLRGLIINETRKK
jgi:hypothetical protein|tara:strand:- start:1807 stop:2103 length:297 start_codon:yes stop_codon:yes gene_type:complete